MDTTCATRLMSPSIKFLFFDSIQSTSWRSSEWIPKNSHNTNHDVPRRSSKCQTSAPKNTFTLPGTAADRRRPCRMTPGKWTSFYSYYFYVCRTKCSRLMPLCLVPSLWNAAVRMRLTENPRTPRTGQAGPGPSFQSIAKAAQNGKCCFSVILCLSILQIWLLCTVVPDITYLFFCMLSNASNKISSHLNSFTPPGPFFATK